MFTAGLCQTRRLSTISTPVAHISHVKPSRFVPTRACHLQSPCTAPPLYLHVDISQGSLKCPQTAETASRTSLYTFKGVPPYHLQWPDLRQRALPGPRRPRCPLPDDRIFTIVLGLRNHVFFICHIHTPNIKFINPFGSPRRASVRATQHLPVLLHPKVLYRRPSFLRLRAKPRQSHTTSITVHECVYTSDPPYPCSIYYVRRYHISLTTNHSNQLPGSTWPASFLALRNLRSPIARSRHTKELSDLFRGRQYSTLPSSSSDPSTKAKRN